MRDGRGPVPPTGGGGGPYGQSGRSGEILVGSSSSRPAPVTGLPAPPMAGNATARFSDSGYSKLVNRAVSDGALAEAVAMVERAGLDRERAMAMLIGGAAGSPIVKSLAERMTTRDYTPHFALELMGKDLRYAYTIREVVSERPAKVQAVLEGLFGTAPEHAVRYGQAKEE